MRNYQKNATMNHSAAMKDLAGSFYEGIFIDSAIGDNRNPAIVECLSQQSDSMGGYLVPDSMEKKIIHSLKENNVIRRLATVIRTDSSDRYIPLLATMSDAQWRECSHSVGRGIFLCCPLQAAQAGHDDSAKQRTHQ